MILLPKFQKVDIDPAQANRLIAVANAAADAASKKSKTNFRQSISVENKKSDGGFDPVTIADRETELAIKQVVQQAYPEHAFLGEEFGEESGDDSGIESDSGSTSAAGSVQGATNVSNMAGSNQPMWIVDPIDGTRAYITGMPLWGTLIALYDGSDVVLGVLEQPVLKERFIGTNFQSREYANPAASPLYRTELITPSGKQTLVTRQTNTLQPAIVQTTTPDFFVDETSAAKFENLKQAVSMVRYGGDCYCYALLAMGYIDIVIERMLEPYDIAALIPIVKGAGGVISDWSGNSAVNGGEVIATANPQLHEQVLALL